MSDTSNALQTTSHEIGPVAPVKEAAKVVKLSAVARKEQERDAKRGTIGDAMQLIGVEIATYTIDHELAQGDLRVLVETNLRAAMGIGLQVEMLKAPTKTEPRECYSCLVDALQSTREAAGFEPIKDSTRDNYLSRIRSYVRDRGANPLDLFGNFAVKAAKKSASAAVTTEPSADTVTEQNQGSPKNPAVQSGTPENLIGLPALEKYLASWIAANDVGMVAEKYRAMAIDFQAAINAVLKS